MQQSASTRLMEPLSRLVVGAREREAASTHQHGRLRARLGRARGEAAAAELSRLGNGRRQGEEKGGWCVRLVHPARR